MSKKSCQDYNMSLQKERKKVLVLVDWFKPGYKAGGPIRSCTNFAYALKNDFDIRVLTTDTDHGEQEPYQNITSNKWLTNLGPDIQVYYARKATLSLDQIKREMISAHADYVYLNHLFSPKFVVYPLWLKFTRQLKSKVVLCPRGALYESALAVKPIKKKPFIKLFRWLKIHKMITFHATNEREKQAILDYFPGSQVIIADNLPESDQPVFVSCKKDPDILKCIFIARIVPIKNLLFLLQVLQQVKKQITVSVAGPIEDADYWAACEKIIQDLPSNIQVKYLGAISNDKVKSIISTHHLFILPTQGENFGHSIFESLLTGRPVLISDQTPWLQLASKKAGWDVPLKDQGKFAQIIDEMASWEQSRFDEWALGAWQYAQVFIENPALKKQYLNLFS
ncbi:glycosyltransferase [Niastella caeni]|uniref:glycosyltransferase n=1 Tax=Niastella caeni TaxID=2569763 RepID=UPI00140E14C5|nr:glycosyltransferase [Niastella caeni]